MANDLQVAAPSNLPSRQEASRLQEEYDDRLLPDEALDEAGKLLAQFPNCKAEDGFIRGLAEVLGLYPRKIALGASVAQSGIASEHQFLSIEAVTAWCNAKTASLRYAVDWNRRAFMPRITDDAPPSQALHLKTRAWLDRDDPDARKMETGVRTDAELKALDDAEIERRRQAEKVSLERSRQDREREYLAMGLELVYLDKERKMVASLPFLLANGWTIEEVNGQATLVKTTND